MIAQTGLRERKKAATKAALGEAALRLALEHGGVEAVTADDIAAAAGVSTRTFHNYFHSKEEALLHDFNELARKLLEQLRESAEREPVWDALRDACVSLHIDRDHDVDLLRCREELVHKSPSLINYQAGQFQELFTAALDIVARASGCEPDDLYPRLLLGSALIAMKSANEYWLAHPEDAPLEAVITRAFAQFEAGVTSRTTE